MLERWSQRRAVEAIAAAMVEAEKKIKGETRPVQLEHPSKALGKALCLQGEDQLGRGGVVEQRGQRPCPPSPPQGQGEDTRKGRDARREALKPVRIPIDCSVLFLSDFRDFSDLGYNFMRIPKLYYL